ncbi:hypothetical protein, partial [Streptococcus pneumoniae]|uniref:hypothetical protein n=1 Tax=Streptococcus pneumoniae TaxID=1313 RepID=UPI001E4A9AA2
ACEDWKEKALRLQNERDQAYSDLNNTINQFYLELTGRLAELSKCRENKATLRAQLAASLEREAILKAALTPFGELYHEYTTY